MSEVLVFIDWYLPGFKAGGPVTSCANMIDALRDDIRFKVVTRNTDYCEIQPYPNLPSDEWVMRGANEEVMYLSAQNQNLSKIKNILSNSDCSTLYINGIYSLKYSLYPILANRILGSKKRVVVASRGMLSESAIGVKKMRKKFFLSVARMFGWYKGVIFHATNQKEKEDILREIGNNTEVVVASNIAKSSVDTYSRSQKETGSLRLVSIARIAPEKNLRFILEVLKDVKADVSLNIYGSVYNTEYWVKCKEIIEKLPKNISVAHLGISDPGDINQIIQQHDMLVLPSLGENYGHVIAESFLAGRPVLISDQTPWKNLEPEHAGYDIPLTHQGFAKVIEKVAAQDASSFDSWCEGAAAKGKALSADPGPRKKHLEMFLNTNSES